MGAEHCAPADNPTREALRAPLFCTGIWARGPPHPAFPTPVGVPQLEYGAIRDHVDSVWALSQDAVLEALYPGRSEEHTSELQSLMRISYAVFCLKKKIK